MKMNISKFLNVELVTGAVIVSYFGKQSVLFIVYFTLQIVEGMFSQNIDVFTKVYHRV